MPKPENPENPALQAVKAALDRVVAADSDTPAASPVPPSREYDFNCPIHGMQHERTYMRKDGTYAAPYCRICARLEEEKRLRVSQIKADALADAIALRNLFGPTLGGDESYDTFTFDRFKTSGVPYIEKALGLCERFADRFIIRSEERELARVNGLPDWRKKNAIGICLRGNCGVGKTFLALSILNRLDQLGVPGYFVSCPSLMQAVLDLPFGEKARAIQLLSRTAVLVLDDIGAQSWKPLEQQLLFQIIDGRIARGRPIIATSNLPMRAMEDCLTPRTAQRLIAHTVAIDAFTWPNLRLSGSAKLKLETFGEGF